MPEQGETGAKTNVPSAEEALDRRPYPKERPADGWNIWAEAFNHLRVEEGEEVGVSREEGAYVISLPPQPTLKEVLEATTAFIEEAGLKMEKTR
ncbi:hypothetical protein KBI33_01520, partial [Candidatus Shapirobacteria bacterium]|nr:hypothetical protein [Candidatus Shapirobacteria bacterium]